MTSLSFLLLGVLLTLILLARPCAHHVVSRADARRLRGQGPRFDLRRHLNGPLLCEGVIYGPTGRVSSRFVADIRGTWDGNVGTLTERFRYDSGARAGPGMDADPGQRRLASRPTAPDVVGDGVGPGRRLGASSCATASG